MGKAQLAVFLASLLAWYSAPGLTAGQLPLGKVVPSGPADLNGTRLAIGTTIYSGDTISTSDRGIASVLLPKGDQLHVGPASRVQLTKAEGTIVATLAHGALLARSGAGQTVSVRAGGILVNPQEKARYEVALDERGLVVRSQSGAVTVQDVKQAFTVPANQAMRFQLADNGVGDNDGLQKGLIIAVAIVAAGAGILAGWLIATNRAEDRCRERAQAVSPAAPSTVCDF